MTLGSFRIVIGETTPKERYLLPQKRIIIIRICKEFAFESENFAQKNERSLSEVLIGVYKCSCLKGQTLIQNKPSISEGCFSASLEKALFCGLFRILSFSILCTDF